MKSRATLLLALSAFAASCAHKPLQVQPAEPVLPKLQPPGPDLMKRPGCVLRPTSFCEQPKMKNDTTG